MKIEDIRPGDVLWYWYTNGHEAGDTIVYHRIVRVNRVTVTAENARGERRRVQPGEYSGKIQPHEWSPWNTEGKA